jgi:hypothetical protein
MQHGIYIGPTPITYYGCVRCQKYHRKGFDAEFEAHKFDQDKHGIRERGPIGKDEEFIAHMLADKGK